MLANNFGPLTVAAVVVIAGTAILKRKYTESDPRYFSAALCGICGIVYAFAKTFLPTEILTQISTFSVMAFAFATGLYKLAK